MNNFYYELTVKPTSYYELFLDLVNSLTSDAIQEINGAIIIRSEDNLEDISHGIIEFKNELSKAFDTKIECETTIVKLENQNWIKKYQDSVKPIIVDKFYIHPSWEEPKKDKLNILINPALAFGSGHHETTNSCLKLICKYIKPNLSVVDVGCGSGILAIGCAKLGAVVDICDTDILALESSLDNFKANDTKCQNSWEGSANMATKTYDVVVANIIADVIVAIKKDLKAIIKNNGIIILSGIMTKYRDKVLNNFQEFQIQEELEKKRMDDDSIKKIRIK